MGKEQELIYAAQNGNIQKLESVLATKEKRFKGSFFGKGLKINWQDQSGYTPLHFASLNGHNDAVVLLLQNDASTYMPDNAGNYPLHLAAFNGHAEVARTLINKGPSRANVNEQNGSGDSALHIAAQYGHRAVLQVLLECHADASTRNEKGESPLDLASQYGKLACVQLIVLSHPYLLHESQPSHSPLHLASRNGHTNVVAALVECGMSVNVMCDLGTPLHEAALYGKISVVKLLLRKGVDVRLRNSRGETVLDVLINHPSQRSQQITALIYEHSAVLDPASVDEMRSKAGSYSGSKDDQLRIGSVAAKSATVPRKALQGQAYDMVPPPRRHSQGKAPSNDIKQQTSSLPVTIKDSSPHYALVTLPQANRRSDSLELATISPLPQSNQTSVNNGNDNSASTSYENEFSFLRTSKLSTQLEQQESLGSQQRQQYDIVPAIKQRQARTPADEVPAPPSSRMSVPAFSSSFETPTTKDKRSISLGQVDSPQPPGPDDVAFQFHDLLQSPDTKPDLGVISEESGKDDDKRSQHDTDNYDNVQITNRHAVPPEDDDEKQQTYEEIKGTTKIKQKRRGKSTTDPTTLEQSFYSETTPTRPAGNTASHQEKAFNEAYEWTKIDDLLMSMKEFTLEQEGTDSCNLFDADSVGSWLATVGLPQYEPSFIANGFDDIRFLGGDVLDESDLLEIGIQNLEHVSSIIKAARNLPRTPQIGDKGFPMPSSVSDWLLAIELSDYESSFSRRGYDTMDRVRVLWELELSTVIDVGLVGHRKRMIYSLGNRPEMRATKKSWAEKFAAAKQPSATGGEDASNDDSIDIAKQLLETAESLVNGFAQRRRSSAKGNVVVTVSSSTQSTKTSPPPDRKDSCVQSEDIVEDSNGRDVADGATATETEEKEPETREAANDGRDAPVVAEEKAVAKSSASLERQPMSPDDNQMRISDPFLHDIPIRAHWKHRPEVLLYEAAVYSTQYLGSHPVSKVTGTSSTLEACNKMKHIAESLQKIPVILLSINARGIEFIDAQSKHVISSYGIKNISYCAQDPEDLRIFAYITKDSKTQRNYCHVFKAASLPLADEIVLTIGQSFELAYERHIRMVQLRHKAKRTSTPSTSSNKSTSSLEATSPGVVKTRKSPPPIPKPY